MHVPPLSARCAGAVSAHFSTFDVRVHTSRAYRGGGNTIYFETCTSFAEVQRHKGNCTSAEHRSTVDAYLCRLICADACDGNHLSYLCQVQIVRALQPWAPRALQVMKQFVRIPRSQQYPNPQPGDLIYCTCASVPHACAWPGNNSSEHLGLYLAQGTEVQVICPCDL